MTDKTQISKEAGSSKSREPVRLQGGLSNDELREAWNRKLPGVAPTDDNLSAFALGVEVGDEPARVYFAERNSARDAWRRRVKRCEELEAALEGLLAEYQHIHPTDPADPVCKARALLAARGGAA